MFRCSDVHVFTCLHFHVFTCLNVYIFTCLHVYIFTCLRVYMFTCKPKCLRKYLLWYMLHGKALGTTSHQITTMALSHSFLNRFTQNHFCVIPYHNYPRVGISPRPRLNFWGWNGTKGIFIGAIRTTSYHPHNSCTAVHDCVRSVSGSSRTVVNRYNLFQHV